MFYVYAILFWFALLLTAIVNAALREKVLKPWLLPTLGKWAHQLSVFTALLLMLAMTMVFLRMQRAAYGPGDLWLVGALWCVMTVIFEFGFGLMRGINVHELAAMYYFWKGELWILLVLGLVILPTLANKLLK
ncbi:MAG: hypothetical protein IPG71_03685 [bacterium]|nr:hypothetical protein [bacterium]